jgi:putative transposase
VILETVEETRERSGWTITGIVDALGLSRSLYYAWRRRASRLDDISPPGYLLDRALPEEVEAVVAYALEHPREGYRRLTWMMVDDDVAFFSPPSVYRILAERDLLCRWKPRSESSGKKPEPPRGPNEQWHTDLMYLWVKGRWYFLVTVLDAYSRYIVHWELLLTMRADDVTDVIHAALEKYPGERPRMVHDRGSQFTGRDFRRLTQRFNLEDIPTKLAHPQSNGLQERWFRTLRQEGLSEADLIDYEHAVRVIGGWVDYYNKERLHAGIQYLPPEEYFRGDPEKRISERKKKLAQARWNRRERNRLVLEKRNAREERSALRAGLQKKEEEVSLTKSAALFKTL